jgi:hypothetical protein
MGLGTTLKISFDAKKVQRGLSKINTSIGNLSKRVAQIGVAAVATGFAALTAGVIAFTISSSNAAASTEALTMQFTTLLGSAEAAQERMEEITKFAAETPFEINELADTSRMLQTMGGTLLATGEGLRLVGDAAAMTGRPMNEVGLAIGRVFGAVTSGTSAGEMVNRLQELGLITGNTKRKFDELAAAQKKGDAQVLSSAQALRLLKGVMSQTEGGMAALATTTQGMKSNMADAIFQIKASFGKGINEGLKIALTAINTKLPQMMESFRTFGALIGDTIADAVNGDYARLAMVGSMIGDAIGGGMKIAMAQAWQNIGNFMNQRKNWITGEVNPEDLAQQNKDKAYLRQSMVEELVGSLKQQYKEAIARPAALPRGAWREPMAGEKSMIIDGKVVQLLEKVANNTAGGTKM